MFSHLILLSVKGSFRTIPLRVALSAWVADKQWEHSGRHLWVTGTSKVDSITQIVMRRWKCHRCGKYMRKHNVTRTCIYSTNSWKRKRGHIPRAPLKKWAEILKKHRSDFNLPLFFLTEEWYKISRKLKHLNLRRRWIWMGEMRTAAMFNFWLAVLAKDF